MKFQTLIIIITILVILSYLNIYSDGNRLEYLEDNEIDQVLTNLRINISENRNKWIDLEYENKTYKIFIMPKNKNNLSNNKYKPGKSIFLIRMGDYVGSMRFTNIKPLRTKDWEKKYVFSNNMSVTFEGEINLEGTYNRGDYNWGNSGPYYWTAGFVSITLDAESKKLYPYIEEWRKYKINLTDSEIINKKYQELFIPGSKGRVIFTISKVHYRWASFEVLPHNCDIVRVKYIKSTGIINENTNVYSDINLKNAIHQINKEDKIDLIRWFHPNMNDNNFNLKEGDNFIIEVETSNNIRGWVPSRYISQN